MIFINSGPNTPNSKIFKTVPNFLVQKQSNIKFAFSRKSKSFLSLSTSSNDQKCRNINCIKLKKHPECNVAENMILIANIIDFSKSVIIEHGANI